MAGMSCVCTHLLLLGSIVQFTTVRRKVQSSGVFEILADMIASPIFCSPGIIRSRTEMQLASSLLNLPSTSSDVRHLKVLARFFRHDSHAAGTKL